MLYIIKIQLIHQMPVRAVLAEKSRNGHTAEIRSLLEKYGATKLSAVDPKHYEALLKDAEVLDDAT